MFSGAEVDTNRVVIRSRPLPAIAVGVSSSIMGSPRAAERMSPSEVDFIMFFPIEVQSFSTRMASPSRCHLVYLRLPEYAIAESGWGGAVLKLLSVTINGKFAAE